MTINDLYIFLMFYIKRFYNNITNNIPSNKKLRNSENLT